MWERLRRFNALGRPAQILFVRGALLLPLVSLSLKLRGFRATQSSLERLLGSIPSPQDSLRQNERAALTIRMVQAAVRHGIGKPSCLEESLVLWWLLARQGLATELRIGIRKDQGKFEAHAWVERDGAALNQPDGQHHHYAAFDATFPTQPPRRE
jgi:hypothetical protein